jgi:hypothetical protein
MVLRAIFNVQSHYIITLDNFWKVFLMEPSHSQNKCAGMLHKNNKQNSIDEFIILNTSRISRVSSAQIDNVFSLVRSWRYANSTANSIVYVVKCWLLMGSKLPSVTDIHIWWPLVSSIHNWVILKLVFLKILVLGSCGEYKVPSKLTFWILQDLWNACKLPNGTLEFCITVWGLISSTSVSL